MGNIVDFDKAKKANKQKKDAMDKRKAKNDKLIKKMKRYDAGFRFKPIYFYIALLLVITIVMLITKIQP